MNVERRRFITTGLVATGVIGLVRTGNAEGPRFAPGRPSEQEEAMNMFRVVAREATNQGFIGTFPNFYTAVYGLRHVAGTIFVKISAAEWRDVPLTDLGNPSLDDFGGRFRGTQEYATRNGFIGGFPNFFHADYGKGIVCGTVLIKPEGGEWRDVPLSELGDHVSLSDIGQRFRGTQDYAGRNSFIGGFPNMFHADVSNRGAKLTNCGTILLKRTAAEWQDFRVYEDPH